MKTISTKENQGKKIEKEMKLNGVAAQCVLHPLKYIKKIDDRLKNSSESTKERSNKAKLSLNLYYDCNFFALFVYLP